MGGEIMHCTIEHSEPAGREALRISASEDRRVGVGPLWLMAMCAIAAIGTASRASAANIANEFSATTNPNGVWTYEYLKGSAYTAYDAATQGSAPCALISTSNACYSSGTIFGAQTYLIDNVSGSNITGTTQIDPSGYLWMDPQSLGVEVVYTAAAAGTYAITGDFLGIDVSENTHTVDILDNGTSVWSGTIASYGADDTFSFSEALSAGDTISFQVVGAPYFYNLGTGLDAQVNLQASSSVAEPGMLSLLVLALAGVGFMRRRKTA